MDSVSPDRPTLPEAPTKEIERDAWEMLTAWHRGDFADDLDWQLAEQIVRLVLTHKRVSEALREVSDGAG